MLCEKSVLARVLIWSWFGGTISPCQGSDSSDEDSSEAPLAAQDVDEGSEDSSSCSGPAVREEEGKTEEDTDLFDQMMFTILFARLPQNLTKIQIHTFLGNNI